MAQNITKRFNYSSGVLLVSGWTQHKTTTIVEPGKVYYNQYPTTAGRGQSTITFATSEIPKGSIVSSATFYCSVNSGKLDGDYDGTAPYNYQGGVATEATIDGTQILSSNTERDITDKFVSMNEGTFTDIDIRIVFRAYTTNVERMIRDFNTYGATDGGYNSAYLQLSGCYIVVNYINGGIEGNVVYYAYNDEWKECEMYYGINGDWQRVAARYGTNGSWGE